MKLPDIPQTWFILALLVGLMGLRAMGIDTFVTAGLSSIIGYLLGTKLEQGRLPKRE